MQPIKKIASLYPLAVALITPSVTYAQKVYSPQQADPFQFTGIGITRSGRGVPYEESANTLPNPLGISTIGELIDKLTGALTIIAVPVVTAMVMWGAFKIVTAGSDPKAVSEGGKIIGYAALGFCLLLLANGVTAIVLSLFT